MPRLKSPIRSRSRSARSKRRQHRRHVAWHWRARTATCSQSSKSTSHGVKSAHSLLELTFSAKLIMCTRLPYSSSTHATNDGTAPLFNALSDNLSTPATLSLTATFRTQNACFQSQWLYSVVASSVKEQTTQKKTFTSAAGQLTTLHSASPTTCNMRSTLECFVASTTRPTSDDCKSNAHSRYRKLEHADKASCRAAQSAPIATTNMHHVIIIVSIDMTETIQNHSRKFICSDIVHSNHLKPFLLRTDQFCSSIKPYQSIKKH